MTNLLYSPSRNVQRIKRALIDRGYTARVVTWEPLGMFIEMGGQEGGWMVKTLPISDVIVGRNIGEVLAWIKNMPHGSTLS